MCWNSSLKREREDGIRGGNGGGGLKVFGEEMSMDNEAGPTVVSEYICLWYSFAYK